MKIDIKKSIKPVNYKEAIAFLEKRLNNVYRNKENELFWILEHKEIYTAGSSYNKNELLNKNIKLVKTNRGGKITYHGPGQIVCYMVIDLKKRNKNIRKFINLIEKTIIESLSEYKIHSFGDPKNIGIWIKDKNEVKKIAAIGIRVSKWIAYHGFSINIDVDIKKYKHFVPCGIIDRGITNLEKIKKQNYTNLKNVIIKNFINNFKI